jgi:hypothetical protein
MCDSSASSSRMESVDITTPAHVCVVHLDVDVGKTTFALCVANDILDVYKTYGNGVTETMCINYSDILEKKKRSAFKQYMVPDKKDTYECKDPNEFLKLFRTVMSPFIYLPQPQIIHCGICHEDINNPGAYFIHTQKHKDEMLGKKAVTESNPPKKEPEPKRLRKKNQLPRIISVDKVPPNFYKKDANGSFLIDDAGQKILKFNVNKMKKLDIKRVYDFFIANKDECIKKFKRGQIGFMYFLLELSKDGSFVCTDRDSGALYRYIGNFEFEEHYDYHFIEQILEKIGDDILEIVGEDNVFWARLRNIETRKELARELAAAFKKTKRYIGNAKK